MTDINWEQYRNIPQILLIVLCIALVLAVLTVGITTAAPFATYNSGWTGTADLRHSVVSDTNTTVLVDSQLTGEPPTTSATTAFVLGVPGGSTAVETTANNVLSGGGTVVVTDEVETTTNRFLEAIGATARVNRGPLRDPQSYYNNPVLPTATTTNVVESTSEISITLNHAGTITPGESTVLATTSEFAYLDQNQNQQFDNDESLSPHPVMTRESVGNGTVIVISDSSVFINAMYEREGNQALAQWLYDESDTLLLTGSTVRPLPQLVKALLWIKSTAFLQTALLIGSFGVVLLASRRRYRKSIASLFERSIITGRTQKLKDNTASEEALESQYESGLMMLLRTEHPEWDRDTVHRLVTAIVARRQPTKIADNEETTDD